MESSSVPFTPLNDNDKKVLDVMQKLGWGMSVERISEASGLDLKDVRFALDWLERENLVTRSFNHVQSLTLWHVQDGRTCKICGEHFKNDHGLSIHRAKAHPNVWVDRSVPADDAPLDSMTMDVDRGSLQFVQDMIRRFSDLPGAKISVTVEFSQVGSA